MRGMRLIDGLRPAESAQTPVRYARSGRRGTTTSGGCGACTEPSGDLEVEVAEGFLAASAYKIDLFCEVVPVITFANATGTDPVVWTGTADDMTVDCAGGTVTFTCVLKATSHLPGGVIVEWSDGVSTWKWKNRTSWDPRQILELELYDGPPTCPCAPFIEFPCLRPIPCCETITADKSFDMELSAPYDGVYTLIKGGNGCTTNCCWGGSNEGDGDALLEWSDGAWTLTLTVPGDEVGVYSVEASACGEPIVLTKDSGAVGFPATITITEVAP